MTTREAAIARVNDLLRDLPRHRDGELISLRLRQLETLVNTMTISDDDLSFAEKEIVEYRKTKFASIQKWRRYSGLA